MYIYIYIYIHIHQLLRARRGYRGAAASTAWPGNPSRGGLKLKSAGIGKGIRDFPLE